jgi:hypothetical protein
MRCGGINYVFVNFIRDNLHKTTIKILRGTTIQVEYIEAFVISSEMYNFTRSLGCFATILAISSSKFLGYTDPVGLDGEQRISSLDFSVILDSRSLGFKRKLLDIDVGRITGVASANLAISG